ncbi:hypothetical protein B0J11DRAFT_532551 [Dendryphion nanum]|uniref:Uncharacterized protein n=1 Tax=Dendryphion nanum TaxID=256645 RepID=A0A9P9DKS9_9PLEO|nr:hypothetical protein B0J11DRAFT_532551 [Dendryphion nanum]
MVVFGSSSASRRRSVLGTRADIDKLILLLHGLIAVSLFPIIPAFTVWADRNIWIGKYMGTTHQRNMMDRLGPFLGHASVLKKVRTCQVSMHCFHHCAPGRRNIVSTNQINFPVLATANCSRISKVRGTVLQDSADLSLTFGGDVFLPQQQHVAPGNRN